MTLTFMTSTLMTSTFMTLTLMMWTFMILLMVGTSAGYPKQVFIDIKYNTFDDFFLFLISAHYDMLENCSSSLPILI